MPPTVAFWYMLTSSPVLKPESLPAASTIPEKSSAMPFTGGDIEAGTYGHIGKFINCMSTGFMAAALTRTWSSVGDGLVVGAGIFVNLRADG